MILLSWQAGLVARSGDAANRSHLHLPVRECAGDAQPLTDMARQLQPVARIDDLDRGGAFLEKGRLPGAGLRSIDAIGIRQPERRVRTFEASKDRDRRRPTDGAFCLEVVLVGCFRHYRFRSGR
jgi:hypothetical protein